MASDASTSDGPAAPAPAAAKPKTCRPKCTFMLHDPKNLSSLGKFVSTDYRYAALKVASRAHKPNYKALWVDGVAGGASKILLRKTNTKEVRVFEGKSIDLKEPKKIFRGKQEVLYFKKPVVSELKGERFTISGNVDDDESVTDAATAAPPAASR